MSLTPNRQRRPTPRPPVRWSLWELALLAISMVMITSPLFAAGYALLVPTVAPARESANVLPQATARATECPPEEVCASPSPSPSPSPSDSPAPSPSDSPEPSPSDSPAPSPSDSPAPSPSPSPSPSVAPSPSPSPSGYPAPSPTACAGYPNPVCPSPSPSPSPSASPSPSPSASPSPSPSASPSPSPCGAYPNPACPSPSPSASPSASPSPFRVVKDALDLNGQGLATISPGGEFLYSIRVDNPVTPAVAVQLTDTFPAEVRPVTIVSTQNGSCGLNAQTLTCTMTPSAEQIATVVVRVRVVAPTGSTINNSATATLGTGQSATGNARVVLVGTGNPTAIPQTPGPTTPPRTPVPTTPRTPVPTTPRTPVPTTPRTPGPTTRPPQPTSRPPQPTSRPPQPTSRPPQPTSPPSTSVPTTRPPQPTAVPATRTPAPNASPAPRTPQPTRKPTVQPTRPPAGRANPQPTRRPNNPQPTAQPQGPTATPAPTATPGPTLPPVTTPVPGQPSIRFNLKSDWGQVFVGDTFEYVITLQNVGQEAGGSSPMMSPSRSSKVEALRNIAPLNNVVISDDINGAFEVIDATGEGLTVKTTGQKIEATRAVLAGGEEVKVRIKVRARPSDVLPVTISNQATLLYTGLPLNVFSNIVDITVAAKNAPTATAAPTNVPTNTPAVGTNSAGGTQQEIPVPARPEELGTNLPQTSGGIPLYGFVLLGLTLLLHSIRAHRARVRI